MSHYSKIFEKIPVDVPNKNGFDCSHENVFTTKCGTLTPCLVDELLPNDTVSLGVAAQVQLPPMATDFYGRVQVKFETFFVPFRILYGGWKELISHPGDTYPVGTVSGQKAKFLPSVQIPQTSLTAGSLADYLGLKTFPGSSGYLVVPNPLPFLAYGKIYEDWYLESRIQQPLFARPGTGNASGVMALPFITYYGDSPQQISVAQSKYADGSYFYSLRQRNWPKDYFTNATPKAQAGDPVSLAFSVADNQGSFTIASLRAANATQQFLERNNKSGYKYGDVINFNYGIYPSDAVTDRCLYLGSYTMDVYNRSVFQTSKADGSSTVNNPTAATPGAKFANSQASGDGSLVDKFTATEHGYLFTIFSLVPNAMYSTGSRRYLTRSSYADFPWPSLASVGDQEIYNSELMAASSLETIGESSGTFGYTQRYSENKYMDDEVHGLLRDGNTLRAFALQRTFDSAPALGSQFLQIPTSYLDQVTAVYGDASVFGCWADCYFKYKKVSTLPAYSIPTLGDPRDTHVEIKDNGGKRL